MKSEETLNSMSFIRVTIILNGIKSVIWKVDRLAQCRPVEAVGSLRGSHTGRVVTCSEGRRKNGRYSDTCSRAKSNPTRLRYLR